MKELNDLPGKSLPLPILFSERNNQRMNQKKREKSLERKVSSDSKAQFRLGAYVRLSPSDEIRDEGSLVSHPQRIKSYVDFRNAQQAEWGEIVEWYTDKDLTGGNMNRPAFLRMLRDIKLGRINAVIATELSRFSRDVKDFLQCWEFLKKHNAPFFSLKENFDTSTPIGEMMVIQCISFAQFERKTIVQRIKEGAKARAERGLASGGQRLLGLDPHPHKKCYLVINEEEAKTVKHVFEQFLKLGSMAKLQQYLNESGFRTKRYTVRDGRQIGGMLFTHSSLHNLLTNLALIGKREINKANRSVFGDELPESERYRVVQAAWPAVIDEKLFWQVQKTLVSNRKIAKPYKHVYRVSGMVNCGACGETMNGQSANGNGGRFFYYGHRRKFTTKGDSHLKRCPHERVPALVLEEAVLGRLSQLSKDTKLIKELIDCSKKESTGSQSDLDLLMAQKEQERRSLERLIDNLTSVLADNPEKDGLKSVLAKLATYENQKTQLSDAIADLRKEKMGRANVIDMEYVFDLFKLLNGAKFLKASAHEQREIIKEVVHRITIDKDGIHLVYYGSQKDDILTEIELGKLDNETNQGVPSVSATRGTPVRLVSRYMDRMGIEPTTSALRTRRSPN